MPRTEWVARLAATAALFGVAAAVAAAPNASASTRGHRAGLHRAVQHAVDRALHRSRKRRVVVVRRRAFAGWAYGHALVPARRHSEGGGVPATFIARSRHRSSWHVALQGTRGFRRMLGRSPRALVPASVNMISRSRTGQQQAGGAAGGGPALSLPWAVGQTWSMWQGPHNTNGVPDKPWTSLDLSGGDGIVRAAADGVVYRPCGNLVVIDHGGGWETGYYHLVGIDVGEGQVVQRGDALGHIGTGTGCGGYANGAHVHFSIYHFPSAIGNHTEAVWHLPTDDIGAIGEVIGGWLVQDGARPSQGCLQRITDGERQCVPNAHIFNGGTIGNGKAVGPGPTTTPTSPSIPSPSLPPLHAPAGTYGHRVYHTCANGVCGLKAHTAPLLSAPVTAVKNDGDEVDIVCQGRGDAVSGRDGSSSTVWDRLYDGSWIADYYVDTSGTNGGFSPPIPQCTTPTAPPPAAPAFFAHHVVGTCAEGACGLKERSGPGYSAFAQTGTVYDGQEIDIACQTTGEAVMGRNATSAIWDRLTNGSYVSDYYTDTPNVGVYSPPIPQC